MKKGRREEACEREEKRLKRETGGDRATGKVKGPKRERAASTPAITTEIETLGEMKLKICDERQSERGGEYRVSWLLIITLPRVTLISTCHRQGACEPVDGKVR